MTGQMGQQYEKAMLYRAPVMLSSLHLNRGRQSMLTVKDMLAAA
jgi:hypothetical protein